jgi:starch synthase
LKEIGYLSINVLLVSAEADPFAKVGGLADVAGSLPKALRRLGVDARVVMPCYGFIDKQRYQIQSSFKFRLPRNSGTTEVEVFTTVHNEVPYYFLRGWPYFGDETSVYGDWGIDMGRFVFFNQAVMEFATEFRRRFAWFPDVIHVHDWHTGLLPFLISENRYDPNWAPVSTMMTLHNMAYQGDNAGGWLYQEGIPARSHPELVSRGLSDNMLAMGIAYSDVVTTVSPRYAVEIQYPYMGYGLDGLIRSRLTDLRGILNGIDLDQWNPETDPKLVANYNADTFTEKRIFNKRQLQADCNLEVRDDIPVIGLVSRLVFQKGIDIALPALRQLLAERDVQFIALGTGEPELNQQLWQIGQDFHWKTATFLGYNATVAQRIYGGVDIFLMPSRYEPCGVGQMLAMRYGALPLVRETGGLADTVQNFDNENGERGTGFSFQWEEVSAVLNTARWALDTFKQKREAWQRMQHRAMLTDFSWDNSAQQYVALFRKGINRRRGQQP